MSWEEVTVLVERAQAGDRAAYGELVRRFQGSVYAMALTRVRDPLEAQELATAVAERVYRSDAIKSALEQLAIGVGGQHQDRLIAAVQAVTHAGIGDGGGLIAGDANLAHAGRHALLQDLVELRVIGVAGFCRKAAAHQ